MTVLASIGTWIQHFHGPVVYLLCGGLVFAEVALLVGFFFPGETAALAGGAIASLHHANLVVMLVVVVGCAIAGNTVGYEIGKLVGPWFVTHRPLRGRAGVRRAEELVARYGGPGVFFGRWVAIIRALMPGIAGMSGMGYWTFSVFTVIGGVAWGVTYVMVGYAAGTAYGTLSARIGIYSGAVVLAIIVGLVVWTTIRRRRRRSIAR